MHGRRAAISIAVPFIRLLRRLTAHDHADLAILRAVTPHVFHTSRPGGAYRPGDVGLPEGGGRAGHGDYREVCLCEVIEGIARRAERRLVVLAVDGHVAGIGISD